MFILDTDHLSFLERGEHPVGDLLLRRMLECEEECVASIISYEEQSRGWLSSIARAKTLAEQIVGYRKLLAQLRNYCAIRVIEFDERAAVELQSLRKAKIRTATMDLKIASIALANNATLLTRNTRDFIKVPGLRFEDWTKE
jgi:tRNA(fMet)-specific endonuclease VapC